MDVDSPEAGAEEVHSAGSDLTKADRGCCAALIVCVLIDVIAACGITSMIFASSMKLWIALVLGIPLGLLILFLIYSVIGSQDSVDMVVTRGILLVLALILFPVFSQARKKAREVTCMSNEKTLVLAVLQYAQDWDGKLPAADRWADLVQPFIIKKDQTSKPFKCPEATSPFGYAFNSLLGGITYPDSTAAAQTVMLFEADAKTRNANGGGELLVRPSRHGEVDVFAYADGHVKAVKPGLVDLRRAVKSGRNQK